MRKLRSVGNKSLLLRVTSKRWSVNPNDQRTRTELVLGAKPEQLLMIG